MAVCDICNAPGHGTLVSSEQMRRAVFSNGFNPFSLRLASYLSALVSEQEAYEGWKTTIVAQDSSDWNVCSRCVGHLNRYLDDAPRASGIERAEGSLDPLVGAVARAEAEKTYRPTPHAEAVPAVPENESKYEGVRGWLALLLLTVTVGVPAGLLVDLALRLPGASQRWYEGNLAALMLNHAVAAIFVATLSIASGIALMRRSRIARDMVALALLAHAVNTALSAPVLARPMLGRAFDTDPRLAVLPGIAAVVVLALIWCAYLGRSERARATYPFGWVAIPTSRDLRGTRTLSLLDDIKGVGFPGWVISGYLAGSVLAARVPAAVRFFLEPQASGFSSSPADLANAAFTVSRIVVRLVPMAVLFALVCTRPMPAWRRIVAWGATSAAALAAQLTLTSTMLAALPESMQEGLFPLPSPTLAGTAAVFVGGSLFMAGIIVAIRWWGLRPLSLVAGVIGADFLFLATVDRYFDPTHWLITGVGGLLLGVCIYAGFFMQTFKARAANA